MNWKVALISFVTLALVVVFGQPVVLFFDSWINAPENASVFCSRVTDFTITVKSRREPADGLTQTIALDVVFHQADGSALTVSNDPSDFLGIGLNGVVGSPPSGAPSGGTPAGELVSATFSADEPLMATVMGTITADPAAGTWTLDLGPFGRAQRPLALTMPFALTIYDLEPCAHGEPPHGVYTARQAFALRGPEIAATP